MQTSVARRTILERGESDTCACFFFLTDWLTELNTVSYNCGYIVVNSSRVWKRGRGGGPDLAVCAGIPASLGVLGSVVPEETHH